MTNAGQPPRIECQSVCFLNCFDAESIAKILEAGGLPK